MVFRLADYDAHQRLTDPARPSAALWRLVLGVAVMAATYLALLWLGSGAVVIVIGDRGRVLLQRMATGETPWGLIALLFVFGLLTAGLAVALHFLHRRGLAGLIGPAPQARRDFLRVALAVTLLSLVFLPVTLMAPDVGQQRTLMQQLPYLPLALLGLLVQTGTEELVFRGYLQSQLSARFRSPLIWVGLPAALFGLVHFDPVTYGANAWTVVVWATVFGALAGDLTARSGSLGAAMGLHFAANFGAIFVVGTRGNLDGLALYTMAVDLQDPAMMGPLLGLDLLGLGVMWLLARVMLRR